MVMAALIEERNIEQAMLGQLAEADKGWEQLGRMIRRQRRMVRRLAGVATEEPTDVERRSMTDRVKELRKMTGEG